MRVLTVVGNRPQFIKAAGVSRHLRGLAEEVLVHTGQHYDPELSDVFFEELEVPRPERHLEGEEGAAADIQTIARGLGDLVQEVSPEAVLIYGDTNSTLAGALAATRADVPLAHVEAGMRSFDRAMPEEVNRVIADHLSELLLCPTATAVENLGAEGLAERAELVGDVQVDVALALGPVAEERSDILDRLELQDGEYAVATAHRPGNVDDPRQLEQLVTLLGAIAHELPVVLPVHPRTRARLEAAGLTSVLGESVRTTDPLGYLDFMALMRQAAAVVTDSGGLQKEAYLAGVPCVTLRKTTEWPETVDAGWNRLAGLDADVAKRALAELRAAGGREPPDPSAYGGGRAGQRVAELIVERLGASAPEGDS